MPEFIYDRTAQDTEIARYLNKVVLDGTATEEERALWATDLKGALNQSDLQRVVDNINLLETMLGITGTALTVPTIPTEDFYAVLRAHLAVLRATDYASPSTPAVPSSPLNSWLKWNAIEKVLYDVYTMYEITRDSYLHCGEGLYAGTSIGVI